MYIIGFVSHNIVLLILCVFLYSTYKIDIMLVVNIIYSIIYIKYCIYIKMHVNTRFKFKSQPR